MNKPFLFWYFRGSGLCLRKFFPFHSCYAPSCAGAGDHQTYRGTKQGYQPRAPSPTAILTRGRPTNPYIGLFYTPPVIPPYRREIQRQDSVNVGVQVGRVEVHEPHTLSRSAYNDGMITLSIPFLCSHPVIDANCFEPEYLRRHPSRAYLLYIYSVTPNEEARMVCPIIFMARIHSTF